jgi:hypothetical protein
MLDRLRFEGMDDKRQYAMPETSYDHEYIWQTSFPTWLAKPSCPYWICGKPASGKSTLMAYLATCRRTIVELESGGANFKIIHFYFDYRAGVALGNNILGMFRMFLYQLASNDGHVRDRLERLSDEGRLKLDSQRHLLDAASEAFEECAKRICIFIDGLDEYTGDLCELVQVCRSMVDRMSVKLCVASRPDTCIPKILNIQSTLMMQEFNERSMRLYVERKIIQRSATDLEIGKRFSKQVVDYLVAKAQGVFLWFRFVVDEIIERFAQGCSDQQIHSLIRQMPLGMNAVYDRILGMISPAQRAEAALILFLAFQLRSLSMWTEESVAPDMEFATTNLDHLWGSYDFIVQQIGGRLNMSRLTDHEELRSRTRELLRGLIEFIPSTKDDARISDLCGITNTSVRLVHETFYVYIIATGWTRRHLPQLVLQYFPDPFWLGFCSRVIEQATKDQVIKPQILQKCVREMTTLMLPSNNASTFEAFNWLYRSCKEYRKRDVAIFPLHEEFCPLKSSEIAEDKVRRIGQRIKNFASANAPDVAFPPIWKSRHVILRTSFVLLMDLALVYERGEWSSFPVIAGALQSYLNPILSYSWWQSHKPIDLDLFRTLLQSLELRKITDLFLAVCGNLTRYFRDRLSGLTLSDRQQDFLYQAILCHTDAEYDPSISVFEEFISIMTSNVRTLSKTDLCFFLQKMKCWRTASDFAGVIMKYTPPDLKEETVPHHSCRYRNKEAGLLFHWAQATCTLGCACGVGHAPYSYDYDVVLELLTHFGEDVNRPCYAGGTVLHALLDNSIQPPLGHAAMNRGVKFLALIDNGWDPKTKPARGSWLDLALAFQRRLPSEERLQRKVSSSLRPKYWYLSTDAGDIKFIIDYLQHHGLHGIWPEYEDSKDDEAIPDDEGADEYATDDEVSIQDQTNDERSDIEPGDDFASDDEQSSSVQAEDGLSDSDDEVSDHDGSDDDLLQTSLSEGSKDNTNRDRLLKENDIVDNGKIPPNQIAQEVSEVNNAESLLSSVDNPPFCRRSTAPVRNTSQADSQSFIDVALNLTWQPPALHLDVFSNWREQKASFAPQRHNSGGSAAEMENPFVDSHQARLIRRKPLPTKKSSLSCPTFQGKSSRTGNPDNSSSITPDKVLPASLSEMSLSERSFSTIATTEYSSKTTFSYLEDDFHIFQDTPTSLGSQTSINSTHSPNTHTATQSPSPTQTMSSLQRARIRHQGAFVLQAEARYKTSFAGQQFASSRSLTSLPQSPSSPLSLLLSHPTSISTSILSDDIGRATSPASLARPSPRSRPPIPQMKPSRETETKTTSREGAGEGAQSLLAHSSEATRLKI